MRDYVTPAERTRPRTFWRELVRYAKPIKPMPSFGTPRVTRERDGLLYIRFRGHTCA